MNDFVKIEIEGRNTEYLNRHLIRRIQGDKNNSVIYFSDEEKLKYPVPLEELIKGFHL